MKRLISLLMAMMLVITALSGLAITASAEEITDESYALTYSGEGAKPYLYGSRYSFDHSYNDPAAGANSVWSYNNCPEIFNLVSSVDGASIAAYCTDADTSTTENTDYRRINLEDSTYHTSGAAAKLRTIILNSFPMKSVEEVAAAANAAGFEVTDLAQGELISATQQAIWETTHGDKYTVDNHYNYIRSMYNYSEEEFVYPESLAAEETEYTASNMENLYNYFMSMHGTAPMADAISESSLKDAAQSYAKNEDGTYTVTATVEVDATIGASDALTLYAIMGEETRSVALTEGGVKSFTFENIAEAADVKFVINGTQTGGDVYLFDAVGARTTSQSMVGYDASVLPAYAEATVAPRILELNKIGNVKTSTTDAEGNVTETTEQIPLQNIQFEIYFVCTMEDYIAGNVTFANAPEVSETELEKYVTEDNKTATVTTDENGFASYNFTENNQPDGIYVIKELHNEYTEAPMDPFYLAVPYTDSNGNVFTTITVNPKNNVENEEIEIEKDVTDIDNEHDTYDIGENHTWIIQSSIPEGMGDGLKYEITDTLDYRLTLVSVDRVAVAKDSGDFGSADSESYQGDENETPAFAETVVLEAETDYVVTIGTAADDAGNTVDQFVVSLTPAGMAKVADAVDNDGDDTLGYDDYEVRVYFTAYINTNAELGVAIPNQACIDYTNNLGMDFDAKSDIPDVQTGGVEINKVDTAGKNLAGARFSIVRAAAEGETADTTITVDSQEIAVVYVAFYATADKSGDKVYEVTTGDDGVALFYGLAYSEKVGTYYIIETEAPAGYNELLAPVAVEVTAASHEDGNEYKIVNTKGFELPSTGGEGTTMFVVGGGVIIAAAVMLIIVPKKKNA